MKPYSLFNSNGEFLVEQLVTVVGWEINPIETEGQKSNIITTPTRGGVTYHVCALGRLCIGWSTRWMVKSRGPTAPVEPKRRESELVG